jgi:hypothetical protein
MAAIWGELSVGPDLGSGRRGTASREVRPYGENGGAAGEASHEVRPYGEAGGAAERPHTR